MTDQSVIYKSNYKRRKYMNKNLNGKWKNGAFKLVIKKNKYVSYYKGFRYGKGTIDYDDVNFTLTSTHASFWLFFWVPFVEIVTGKYTNTEDIFIIVSNINGRYSGQIGKWENLA